MRLEISLGVRRVRVWCAQWLVLVPISRSCSIILLGPPALPWRHPFFCSATRCHRMAQGAGPRAAAAKGQAAAEYAERVLVMAQSCTSFPRTNGSPRPPAQPRSQGARLFAAHRQRRCAHHHRLERTAQQPSAATSSDGASSSGGNVPWGAHSDTARERKEGQKPAAACATCRQHAAQCRRGAASGDFAQRRASLVAGFGFQLNERYLEWDPEGAAAAQLIKLTLVNTLGLVRAGTTAQPSRGPCGPAAPLQPRACACRAWRRWRRGWRCWAAWCQTSRASCPGCEPTSWRSSSATRRQASAFGTGQLAGSPTWCCLPSSRALCLSLVGPSWLQKTTRHLLGLRELLPNTNVSQLVTRW